MQRLNLTGNKFGRLTVIEFHGMENGHGIWRCKCDCGNSTLSKGTLLKNGTIKSCGCYRTDMGKIKNRTHGLSGYRPYYVWKDMLRRCYDNSRPEFPNYGGRGIRVCDEWKKSVESFCQWAKANGYEKGLTIDRKDNSGNYEPSNCTWVTMKVQANNKRNNSLICICGEIKTISEWAEVSGIKYETLWSRIGKGWLGFEIIKPIDKRYSHRKLRLTK